MKTKGFFDVFFDNVGGEILDLALGRAKAHARIVMCGEFEPRSDHPALSPDADIVQVAYHSE